MANEIVIPSIASGLTVTVQLYSGTSAQGGSFSATEIGTTGCYVANMPANIPYGQYSIVATAGGNTVAAGAIFWDGAYELATSLSMLQGLDPNNIMTVTPTSRNAGNINLVISGDGVTNTEVHRS